MYKPNEFLSLYKICTYIAMQKIYRAKIIDMLENEGKKAIQDSLDQEYIEKVKGKFTEQSMIRIMRKRVSNCRNISYGFQVFSLLTLGYFVYYMANAYTGVQFAIVLTFLLLLAAAWEAGKRYTIIETFDGAWNPNRKWKLWFAPLVFLLVAGSIAGSYIGGDQFIKNETAPPLLVHNPQIDSLKVLVETQQNTIAQLQNTKWKGSITRDATRGINESKKIQARILDQIANLQQKEDAENEEIVSAYTAKKSNLGAMTGTIAGLMDVLLLIFLGVAERLETMTDKMLRGQSSGSSPSISIAQNPASSIAPNPYTNLNSNGHRKIGFEIPKGGFDTTQNRVTQADTEVTRNDTETTRNPQKQVARDTQPDTQMTRHQNDPDSIVKMIKRVRQRWARSFEDHPQAPKSPNTRKELRDNALEEWGYLEDMGYKITENKELNNWGLDIVSPQKQ